MTCIPQIVKKNLISASLTCISKEYNFELYCVTTATNKTMQHTHKLYVL